MSIIKNKGSVTYESNCLADSNIIIEQVASNILAEVIAHFCAPKPKQRAKLMDDARYLYNDSELETFIENYTKSDVQVHTIYNKDGTFFCYELYRDELSKSKEDYV